MYGGGLTFVLPRVVQHPSLSPHGRVSVVDPLFLTSSSRNWDRGAGGMSLLPRRVMLRMRPETCSMASVPRCAGYPLAHQRASSGNTVARVVHLFPAAFPRPSRSRFHAPYWHVSCRRSPSPPRSVAAPHHRALLDTRPLLCILLVVLYEHTASTSLWAGLKHTPSPLLQLSPCAPDPGPRRCLPVRGTLCAAKGAGYMQDSCRVVYLSVRPVVPKWHAPCRDAVPQCVGLDRDARPMLRARVVVSTTAPLPGRSSFGRRPPVFPLLE